jgi:hypothetical protein
MLALLLSLLLTTPPIPPGCAAQETSSVCLCKQGNASACEALRQTDPKLAAELEKAAARKRAEAAQQGQTAAATGQNHHLISKRIADALNRHPTLRGHYTARDPRFVTRAADKASHNGYQQWHRKVDEEIIEWLDKNKEATPKQFERLLKDIYSRPEMRARFPDGL